MSERNGYFILTFSILNMFEILFSALNIIFVKGLSRYLLWTFV